MERITNDPVHSWLLGVDDEAVQSRSTAQIPPYLWTTKGLENDSPKKYRKSASEVLGQPIRNDRKRARSVEDTEDYPRIESFETTTDIEDQTRDKYRKKPRHKPHPDHYAYKKAQTNQADGSKSRKKRKEQASKFLSEEFHAPNVMHGRLTLPATPSFGFFQRGKISSLARYDRGKQRHQNSMSLANNGSRVVGTDLVLSNFPLEYFNTTRGAQGSPRSIPMDVQSPRNRVSESHRSSPGKRIFPNLRAPESQSARQKVSRTLSPTMLYSWPELPERDMGTNDAVDETLNNLLLSGLSLQDTSNEDKSEQHRAYLYLADLKQMLDQRKEEWQASSGNVTVVDKIQAHPQTHQSAGLSALKGDVHREQPLQVQLRDDAFLQVAGTPQKPRGIKAHEYDIHDQYIYSPSTNLYQDKMLQDENVRFSRFPRPNRQANTSSQRYERPAGHITSMLPIYEDTTSRSLDSIFDTMLSPQRKARENSLLASRTDRDFKVNQSLYPEQQHPTAHLEDIAPANFWRQNRLY
ncbi:hypothetical protein ASPZODRAFT_130707 [Penicilliopsis zonata CBS 506.65]|uniref:Uncharacterized protein n=1 Tax=Penicilliopsis zonata CBS 506.65 TaxID=1073090 RepID=A0A1L9SNC0_9EURO|nr:hypothetical protein ASPZODRAFT_130707 [Penicilliopsis zonata CBS 506.65]OJJ48616.1 hypothetical protein ASPZODRAFT_130707 [Penicilliopsis zonata CBS 506.65]